MKKGQVQTQIFVYIVAIVVLGMILVFGYRAIKGFGDKGTEIEQIQFKKDVENTFRQVRSSFGQVKKKDFRIPSKYDEVCLIDLGHDALTQGLQDYHNPLIESGVEEKNNLFLLKGIDVEGFNVGPLHVDANVDPDAEGDEKYNYRGAYEEAKRNNDPTLGFVSDKDEIPGQEGYILCFKPRQGRVKMLMKGMGDYVLVTQG